MRGLPPVPLLLLLPDLFQKVHGATNRSLWSLLAHHLWGWLVTRHHGSLLLILDLLLHQ
jgi:hypothetical protein